MAWHQTILKSVIVCILLVILLVQGLLLMENQRTQIESHDLVDYMIDAGVNMPTSDVEEELLEHRKIVITTDINAASAQKVINGLLLLDSRDNAAPIDLYIKTFGGGMDAAFAIIDVMNGIKAPVNTHATGSADSAGAMILAAGTGTRFAYAYSSIMFHAGLYNDVESYAQDKVDNERLIRFWEQHSGMPKKRIYMKEDREFSLSPEEALKFEIIDRIVDEE